MSWMTFDGFEIKVQDLQEVGIDVADVGRTARGKERRDAVAAPRAWEVTTPPMHWASEIAPLEMHLRAILWGYGDFWMAPFGPQTNTIRARIEYDSWTKAWLKTVPDFVSLTFRVIEQ